jgi:hypothetical protein
LQQKLYLYIQPSTPDHFYSQTNFSCEEHEIVNFQIQDLKNQIDSEKQINLLLSQRCENLLKDKEYYRKIIESSEKIQHIEQFKQVQQQNYNLAIQQFELDHNHWKHQLEEYLSAPPSSDSHQEEADRLRFLFLSHFSNLLRTQEIHDYFYRSILDENDFEEFF